MESKNLEGHLVTLPLFFRWLINQETVRLQQFVRFPTHDVRRKWPPCEYDPQE